jgi:glycosyltransferase involved in cell wall biosynthesis
MSRYYAPGIEGERIPLGIRKPPERGAAARGDYGLSPSDTILVTVGRLIARKGLMQLLELMDHLRGENVRLLIVGNGPLEDDLKKETSARELGGQVRFLGRVEEAEKFRILRMCDLFVSSSQHEGFGLVFLEAMACQLPVVCYDHGGQTDFLEDRKTGHLVPLNDRGRFESSCRRLISDREARARIGQHNLQRVEEYFIQNCARRYEDLFERVVRGYAPRAAKKPACGT